MTPATFERACPRCAYRTTGPVERCPLCDVSLWKQERTWKDARRAFRVPLPAGVQGALDGQMAVAVVDLSPLGARLTHAEALRPNRTCLLSLDLPETAPLCFPASIVWTRTHLLVPESGEARWLYSSGVEFRNSAPTVTRDVSTYLNRVEGGRGALPGTLPGRGE